MSGTDFKSNESMILKVMSQHSCTDTLDGRSLFFYDKFAIVSPWKKKSVFQALSEKKCKTTTEMKIYKI